MNLTELVCDTELFRGISAAEADSLVVRLNAVSRTYAKGETVVHAGQKADRLMAVASGSLLVYEHTGERPVLVRELGRNSVLGLWIMYVRDVEFWPGAVVAAEKTTLVSFSIERMRELSANSDPTLARIAVNAAKIISREMFSTWRKLMVMDAPSIEAKIKIYLSELDNETGRTGTVRVPFDRERMAEYFGVTRPALSRAIGAMRDHGLLEWRKNVFRINF